jgi:predicted nucleic acid-binding protein
MDIVDTAASSIIATDAAPAVPRIVLDTNVCLDLFHFGNAGCAALASALSEGRVQAVTRADCRDEWLRVLEYPSVPIDPPQRPSRRERFDAQVQLLHEDALDAHAGVVLPRCLDPDDQMFLELALASGARWLLSKDKQLLKLNRRTLKAGLFRILKPEQWTLDLL